VHESLGYSMIVLYSSCRFCFLIHLVRRVSLLPMFMCAFLQAHQGVDLGVQGECSTGVAATSY